MERRCSEAARLAPAVFLAVALAAQAPDLKFPHPAPGQPLPFSHKLHAGSLGLKCATCHTMPDPGELATLPATAVCMGCHRTVKKDSPSIAKLARSHEEGKPIEWAPVYRIPSYVYFSHKAHLAVEGVGCESCHGPVRERDVLRREKDLTMQGCMECHRAKRAPNDCNYCHEQR